MKPAAAAALAAFVLAEVARADVERPAFTVSMPYKDQHAILGTKTFFFPTLSYI